MLLEMKRARQHLPHRRAGRSPDERRSGACRCANADTSAAQAERACGVMAGVSPLVRLLPVMLIVFVLTLAATGIGSRQLGRLKVKAGRSFTVMHAGTGVRDNMSNSFDRIIVQPSKTEDNYSTT